MRRRLTVAILAVVIGTLLLTVAGGLLLVRRAATSTAQSDLTGQAQSLGQLLSTRAAAADQTLIRVLKKVGSYEDLVPVGLSPTGSFGSLPAPLTASALDVGALEGGQTVSGNIGDVVYAAVPIDLNRRERTLQRIPLTDTPVLVVTKVVTSPVNGVAYFVLVAGAVLVLGAAVAAFVARRISAPLVRAVGATRRMAAGDLDARVPVTSRDGPELAEVAVAINSLGEGLGRARGLERQFLMSVSHELRTPLTSIRGYADAVAEGATDDVVGAAGVIASESKRLERLVQDLLDLARLDARQFSLHVQRVDAGDIAEGVADGFRREADSMGLELTTSVPDGGVWVEADPDRLAQVVANLVENAFKFASRSVEVGAATRAAESAIWVTDDGPGVSAEDIPHVFERHFRSDRVPARRMGSGLGLAIVAELAAAMGATVNVESPLPGGRGTRMVLWLPARPGSAPPGATLSGAGASGASGTSGAADPGMGVGASPAFDGGASKGADPQTSGSSLTSA